MIFLSQVNKTTVFTAYLNQDQLNNPAYGTKEKPVPIWGKDLLLYNEKTIKDTNLDDMNLIMGTFYVKPETMNIFIGQYLSRFMLKEEYKEMFKK